MKKGARKKPSEAVSRRSVQEHAEFIPDAVRVELAGFAATLARALPLSPEIDPVGDFRAILLRAKAGREPN
jgi:hypothetical protein